MMPTHVNEIELLRGTLAGRTESFEVLVRQYQSLVCAITYGATGSVDRSEELAQQTFLLAWKNLRQLKDLTKFKAWLCRIARNVAQNWHRSQHRDVAAGAAPLEAASAQSATTSPPEEVAIEAEQRAVVDQALKGIPEGYRVPLILFYREHKSAKEVAEILEVSENTARQRISRARSLLKDRVASMVETGLADSKPGKAFTAAVVASVAGTVLKGSAVATAATATAAGVSGLTAKIAAIAAGIIVLAGTAVVIIHKETSRPPTSPDAGNLAAMTYDAQPSAAPAPETGDDQPTDPMQPADVAASALGQTDPADERADAPPLAVGTETTAFVFQPQGVLSGLITDAQTGAPVRDATVRLASNGANLARTDAHGFYHIDKTFYSDNDTVFVDSNDYVGFGLNSGAPILSLSPDRQVVQHFQLDRACKAEVWVTDANGAPIEGAEVILTSLADTRRYEVNNQGRPRRTDRHGHLLLGGIPSAATEYLITVIAKEAVSRTQVEPGIFLVETQLTHSPGRAVVRLTDPNTIAQVTVALEEGQTLYGYAEYEDNQPAAGVKLGIQPAWWHCMSSQDFCTTNPDGTFAIDHVTPGTYNILLATTNPDGLPMSSRTIAQKKLPPGEDGVLLLQVPGLSAQTGVSISGRLIFGDGTEPFEIMIAATAPGLGRKTIVMSVASSRGRGIEPFVLDGLEAGRYRLQISGDGLQDVVLEDIPAPTTDLDVEMAALEIPRLEGFVCDGQTGKPIKQFEIRLRKLETLAGMNMLPSDRWVVIGSDEGHFSLETVGPGVYQVQVLAEGYAPAWSEPINTDESRDVLVALSTGGTLTGRILNQAGDPIEGAKVIPLSWAGDTRDEGLFGSDKGAAVTNEGVFALPHLPEGLEAIQIIHPDYARQVARDIEIEAGRATSLDAVVLTSGGSVEGVVLDEQDRPLADQTLTFCDRPGGQTNPAYCLATVVTDAYGYYRVDHLPAQLCYVHRSNIQRGVARRVVAVRADEVVGLDFGGALRVSGRLDTPDGQWSQRRLRLQSQTPGQFACFTQTEKSGDFSFSGVVSGTYVLEFEDAQGSPHWKTVTIVTVTDADLELGVLEEAEMTPGELARLASVAALDVSPEPCPRRLSVKLPLVGTHFHWTFVNKADFLAGRLVVRIGRGQAADEIVVFDRGRMAQGWEAMDISEDLAAGEIYAGFLSSQTYLTAPRDTVEIELTVVKDLPGIGPLQTGILPAGTYTARGTYTLLTDEYAASEALQGLPAESQATIKDACEFKAFIESLEPQWPLEITSDDGWLDPERREQLSHALQQLNSQR